MRIVNESGVSESRGLGSDTRNRACIFIKYNPPIYRGQRERERERWGREGGKDRGEVRGERGRDDFSFCRGRVVCLECILQ